LASHHQGMSNIYREAATQLAEIRPQADVAETIADLEGISGQVREIVHSAMEAIAAYRPGHDEKDHHPGTSVEADTGGSTGDRNSNDQSDDTDDAEGAEDDQQDEDTTGDDQRNDDTEQTTILATLNAMELEVDMYQIEVSLALVPGGGYGFPEGPAALTAGDEVLDAIDAARVLTGDDLVLAYLETNDLYNAYIQLLIVFDLKWEAGIFNGQVTPI
jgi:hypothetical protein